MPRSPQQHIVNRILAPLGIRLQRIQREEFGASGQPTKTRVGRFDILMYPSSQLFSIYKSNPEYSDEIGRIAALAHKKYPRMRVIDIGANVGDTLAVIRSHAEVPVLAIEGDGLSYTLLAQNAKQFPESVALRHFLGERMERVQVKVEKAGWNTTLLPTHGGTADAQSDFIEIDTLDRVLKERPERGEYKVIKIDTEGFDMQIIRGASEFLAAVRPVIFMEYNRPNFSALGEDGLQTLSKLEKMGYNALMVWDPNGRFMLSTKLAEWELINDLDAYVGAGRGALSYLDFCLFHSDDASLADDCLRSFREHRVENG